MEAVFVRKYEAEVWDGSIEGAQKISEFTGGRAVIVVSPSGDIKLESEVVYLAMSPGDVVYKDETSGLFSLVDAELVKKGEVVLEKASPDNDKPLDNESIEFAISAAWSDQNMPAGADPSVQWKVWKGANVHNSGTITGDGYTRFMLSKGMTAVFEGAVNIRCV